MVCPTGELLLLVVVVVGCGVGWLVFGCWLLVVVGVVYLSNTTSL